MTDVAEHELPTDNLQGNTAEEVLQCMRWIEAAGALTVALEILKLRQRIKELEHG